MNEQPPDSGVDQLKKDAWRYLFPRFAVAIVVLLIMALYIFWPR